MKDKFQRFMAGRYGVDELGKYSLYLTIALLIIGLFVRSRFLNGITFILVLVLYFRMFSKNYAQRRKENEIFLKYKNQAVCFRRFVFPEERERSLSPVRNAKPNSSKKAEVRLQLFLYPSSAPVRRI